MQRVPLISCDDLEQLKDSIDARSFSGGDIHGFSVAPVNGCQVGVDDVEHRDEVSFLGAVTEDRRLFPFEHGLAEDGHNPRFSVGVLSWTENVPIAQGGVAQPVESIVKVQVLFRHPLGHAVGCDRRQWGIVGDRYIIGVAVQRSAGAGVDDLLDTDPA